MSKDHAKALVTPACLTTGSAQDSEPLEARSNRPEALPSHQNPLLLGRSATFPRHRMCCFKSKDGHKGTRQEEASLWGKNVPPPPVK